MSRDSPKEFLEKAAEHLRTIQFSVLATSLALCVASTIDEPASINLAVRELSVINSNIKHIADDILRRKRANGYSDEIGGVWFRFEETKIKAALLTIEKKTDSQVDVIPAILITRNDQKGFVASEDDLFQASWGSISSSDEIMKQITLDRLRDTWKTLQSAQAYKIEKQDFSTYKLTAYFTPVGYAEGKVVAVSRNGKFDDLTCTLSKREFTVTNNVWHQNLYLDSCSMKDVSSLSIEVPTRALPVAMPLLDNTNHDSPKQEDLAFDKVYPNFSYYSVGQEFATLEKIKERFDRIQLEKKNDVELYGVKIPQEHINIWGLCILIVLNVYFIVHQDALLAHLGLSDLDFPWVGVYLTRSGAAVSVLTNLLPISVAMVVAYKHWNPTALSQTIVLASLASFVAGTSFYIIWQGRILRRRLQYCRKSAEQLKSAFGD